MSEDILAYHERLDDSDKKICDKLHAIISKNLRNAEGRIWHAHPVWFFDGNPIVGYSKQKAGIRLMFWSGTDFGEEKLVPGTGKFKDASIYYSSASQVGLDDLHRWLEKSQKILWDYKNIVKRKGALERLK